MSSTYTTHGIVLHRYDWRENDSLFHILTKDFGKITVVAVGSKKIKSKLMGHLSAYGIVDLMVARAKAIDKLAGARLVERFPVSMENDYAYITIVQELILRTLEDGERDQVVWDLVCGTVQWIGRAATSEEKIIAVLFFTVQLLRHLGYGPELEECVQCGNPVMQAHFSIRDNSVVCQGCARDAVIMTPEWLQLFTRMVTMKAVGEPLHSSTKVIHEGMRFVARWSRYVIESPLCSWDTLPE